MELCHVFDARVQYLTGHIGESHDTANDRHPKSSTDDMLDCNTTSASPAVLCHV